MCVVCAEWQDNLIDIEQPTLYRSKSASAGWSQRQQQRRLEYLNGGDTIHSFIMRTFRPTSSAALLFLVGSLVVVLLQISESSAAGGFGGRPTWARSVVRPTTHHPEEIESPSTAHRLLLGLNHHHFLLTTMTTLRGGSTGTCFAAPEPFFEHTSWMHLELLWLTLCLLFLVFVSLSLSLFCVPG